MLKERKIIKWGSGAGVDITSMTNKKPTEELYAQNTGSDKNNVRKEDKCFIRKLSEEETNGKNVCLISQSFLDERDIRIGDWAEVNINEEMNEVLINKKDKDKEAKRINQVIEKGKLIHPREEIKIGNQK